MFSQKAFLLDANSAQRVILTTSQIQLNANTWIYLACNTKIYVFSDRVRSETHHFNGLMERISFESQRNLDCHPRGVLFQLLN